MLLEVMYGNRINIDSHIISIDGEKLLDKENKIYLVYCEETKKMRRKEKNKYKYLNFFDDCGILVDLFLEENDKISHIDIEENDYENILKFIRCDNKVIYLKVYEKEIDKKISYYITKFIEDYIEELEL